MAEPVAYKLLRESGEAFALPASASLVLGRGVDADIFINDPTLSRRHAQIINTATGPVVRDLGSSNGTCVNGRRIQESGFADGDTLSFGSLSLRVEKLGDASAHDDEITATILQQRTVSQPASVLGALPADGTMVIAAPSGALELTQRKLALLLEVSTALSRVVTVDALLEQIADYVFQTMNVDRLAILLTEPDGDLSSRVARDRHGGDTARVVPRSIARRVVSEKIAVVSANAAEDKRFDGASIVMQSVRSAMCAPLVGMEGTVLGVLYVDNRTVTQSFSNDDLAFLVAFSGIAAVAIENGRYGERIRTEAVARGNFERFFTPALAARIARSTDALTLGGEKRRVVVLFSDIRGFTSLSETMPPEDLAHLLSEYFTAMVECIFRYGGTLDKFIGDAIMAQWGAPLAAADDADRALAAAFDMQDALNALNERWRTQGRSALRVGIGINTGDVFAGYIGSERRLEYTIIGEAVNVASRLCSAAGGGEILMSQEMLEDLNLRPPVEERTGLQLKNVGRAVGVYRVTARPV